ncbi:T9SS type A sorting domain-containing protein [Epilithonimonas sp.]|uniref:T9SS type A sorting domain-containing protein n=1 Tax=Epilithonimonas sp. TaxID=2894511 RepID=UPI00289E68AF|nr:T9SS type A sorting domain-containing protein [Epilithonimonas sp.]
MTPKEGYEVESVIVDNEDIGKQLTYTFADVTENHTILAVYKEKQLGTDDINKKNITVYPNPTTDRIFVSGNKKVTSLELYNIAGQKVLQFNENNLDLTSLTAGVYVLKIKTENGEISSSKIIKK